MIFIILPVTVYTLFIMRMKPNNKQNTSREFQTVLQEGPSWSLLGAIYLKVTLPLAEYDPLCPLDGTEAPGREMVSSSCSRVFRSSETLLPPLLALLSVPFRLGFTGLVICNCCQDCTVL